MTTTRGWIATPDRRLRRIFAAFVIFGTVLSFVPTRPTSAASNGLWSVFPTARPGQAPRAFVRPVLTPGESYEDSVTVANYTASPLTFHLYGADALNTRGGGLSLRRRTDVQVDIGRWIRLPYSELTVPPRSASVVPFTILPPSHASPGDHVGGIVAEQTQGTTSRAGSIPITVIQAVGVRVYGRVVGPLHPALALSNLSLTVNRSAAAQFGGAVDARVRFSVRNAGNTVLSPATSVVLTTPVGTAARRTFTVNELLPGSAQAYSMTFSGLNAFGHLRAEVRATSARAEASGAATAWVVPWALFVVILGALMIIVIVVRARRHRHNAAPPPQSP